MTLIEKIAAELKEAMKAGDKLRVSTLRLLNAQILNEKISLKKETLTDEELLKIVQKEAKKRKEAAESFRNASRLEDAEKEETEKKILESYLPQQISDEDLEKIVVETIKEISADKTNIGQVIGKVMAKVRGKADGNRVRLVVERIIAAG